MTVENVKFPLLSIITVISSFEQNPTCYPNLTFTTIGTLIIFWLDNFHLEFRGSFFSQDEGDTMRSLLIVKLRAIRLVVIKNVALSSSHDIPTPTPTSSTMALEHPETNPLVVQRFLSFLNSLDFLLTDLYISSTS